MPSFLNIPDFLNGAVYLAVLSDSVVCGRYCQGSFAPTFCQEKLLELRVFNEKGEFRCFRDHLSAPYLTRCIDDKGDTRDRFDEVHYLDQDSRFTSENGDGSATFRTTGGGFYSMPGSAQIRRVKVRSYLATTMNGLQYCDDWRIVGFLEN